MGGVRCPILVGREAEVAELTALLGGDGGCAFVLGEAGIGKSRLLTAVAEIARSRDVAVLWGRAGSSPAAVPYRPLSEALLSRLRGQDLDGDRALGRYRQALAVLTPGLVDTEADGSPSVVLLGEATLALAERCAGRGGALIVLEDLHWADAETCELLEYLSDKLPSTSISLIGSMRTGTSSAAEQLAAELASHRLASVVTLHRLDEPHTEAVIAAALGSTTLPPTLPDTVAASSGGLPLLIEEQLAALVDADVLRRHDGRWEADDVVPTLVPSSVARLTADRLAALDDPVRRILAAAAVLGERFDWTLLGAISGLDDLTVTTALHRAVGAQLLDESPAGGSTRFRFRHGLSRSAVLDALDDSDRHALAGRALDVLGADAATSDWGRLELVAELAVMAGDTALGAGALVEASREAARRGACAAARRFAELAVRQADESTDVLAARDALLDALCASGDTVRATEVGRQLLAQLVDPAQLADVHRRLAEAAVQATDWSTATALVEAAAALAGPGAAILPTLDRQRAAIALGHHRPDVALVHADRALNAAHAAGDHRLAAEALELIGTAHRVSDVGAAQRAFAEAVAEARRTGSDLLVARTNHALATIDVLLAGPTEATERARRLALDAGALGLVAICDHHLAILHWLHFDLEGCRSAAARATDAAIRYDLGLLKPMAAMIATSVDAVRGQRAEPRSAFQELRAEMDDESEATWRGHVLAVSALATEDRSSASAQLSRALALAPRFSDVARAPHAGLHTLLAAVDGDPRAPVMCASLDDDTGVVGVARWLNDAAFAVVAGRDGDADVAMGHLAPALESLQVAPWFRAITERLVAEAALVDGWGTPVPWLRSALAFFEDAGVVAPAEACRALLKQAGAAMPRQAAEADHSELAALGITRREADVLALVAEGLANREVAERLYLSVRTVEKHVERLMTKTQTANRTQLAAMATRLSLPSSAPT